MKQYIISIHYNTWNVDLTENDEVVDYMVLGTSIANAKGKALKVFQKEINEKYHIIKTTFVKIF